MLQIPFGWASDRWGRKPVIVVGLVLFALGSFVAAWAPTIGWTIVGRTLQGAGAISAAVIALTADLTRDAVRTRAMAVIGMTIGATFALSLVAGPALQRADRRARHLRRSPACSRSRAIGLAASARCPRPSSRPRRSDRAARQWRRVLVDGQLLRLNYGIFALHAALMALFVQVPFMLRDNGVPRRAHWLVYLPVLLVSVVLMLPAMMRSRPPGPRQAAVRRRGRRAVRRAGAAGARRARRSRSRSPRWSSSSPRSTCSRRRCRRSSPSTRRRRSRAPRRGVYSSVQFLGTFVGAAAGGWLSQHHV